MVLLVESSPVLPDSMSHMDLPPFIMVTHTPTILWKATGLKVHVQIVTLLSVIN